MLLISYCNSELVAPAWRKIGPLWKKKIRYLPALDLMKCLKQIRKQRLPLTCEPISELTSNISNI